VPSNTFRSGSVEDLQAVDPRGVYKASYQGTAETAVAEVRQFGSSPRRPKRTSTAATEEEEEGERAVKACIRLTEDCSRLKTEAQFIRSVVQVRVRVSKTRRIVSADRT